MRVALDGASTANNAQQDGDDGNDQQDVDNTAGEEAAEEAYSPDDDQNYSDDIQEISHGFVKLKKDEGEVKDVREVSLGHCTGVYLKGYTN